MGKSKKLIDCFDFGIDISEEEILDELYSRNDYDYQYESWLNSPEYVEYVNMEIEKTKPIYSESDIISATRYASTHITIQPQEVGKNVYDILFSEKIQEYLSLKR
tara:strand:- start:149 stop:463 length:315 start_codon:yes stop_codon:yes gene_type:complete